MKEGGPPAPGTARCGSRYYRARRMNTCVRSQVSAGIMNPHPGIALHKRSESWPGPHANSFGARALGAAGGSPRGGRARRARQRTPRAAHGPYLRPRPAEEGREPDTHDATVELILQLSACAEEVATTVEGLVEPMWSCNADRGVGGPRAATPPAPTPDRPRAPTRPSPPALPGLRRGGARPAVPEARPPAWRCI